jgi:membrane protein insertase Oxa1/YidC/SpoIIIJ
VKCRDCRKTQVTSAQLCEDCGVIQAWEITGSYYQLDAFHLFALGVGLAIPLVTILVRFVQYLSG